MIGPYQPQETNPAIRCYLTSNPEIRSALHWSLSKNKSETFSDVPQDQTSSDQRGRSMCVTSRLPPSKVPAVGSQGLSGSHSSRA